MTILTWKRWAVYAVCAVWCAGWVSGCHDSHRSRREMRNVPPAGYQPNGGPGSFNGGPGYNHRQGLLDGGAMQIQPAPGGPGGVAPQMKPIHQGHGNPIGGTPSHMVLKDGAGKQMGPGGPNVDQLRRTQGVSGKPIPGKAVQGKPMKGKRLEKKGLEKKPEPIRDERR